MTGSLQTDATAVLEKSGAWKSFPPGLLSYTRSCVGKQDSPDTLEGSGRCHSSVLLAIKQEAIE